METHTPTALSDPVAVIRQIDPDDVRRRLEALEEDRRALLILLRAALIVSPRPTKGKAVQS